MFKTSYKMIVLQVLHVATIESDLGRCKRSKKLSLFMHFSFNFQVTNKDFKISDLNKCLSLELKKNNSSSSSLFHLFLSLIYIIN